MAFGWRRAGMRSYFCCLASSVKHLRNVDEVKLSCCVWPYLDRSYQVTWFFNNVQAVESDDLKMSNRSCGITSSSWSAAVKTSPTFTRAGKTLCVNWETSLMFSFRASRDDRDLGFASLTQVRLQQQQLCPAEELRTQEHSEVDVMNRCSFRMSHHCCCCESLFFCQTQMWSCFCSFVVAFCHRCCGFRGISSDCCESSEKEDN